MASANVKIKFESFNEHNFLIDIAGTDAGAIHGLTLLQEELPAEISFHVPEVYHKRIIGVGGRSIQRIMKKYGVYVKFNSAEELSAACLDDEDNVLARTPAKNALNLDNLKSSVMELVNPKDKDYIVETVRNITVQVPPLGALKCPLMLVDNHRFPSREDIIALFLERRAFSCAISRLRLIPRSHSLVTDWVSLLARFYVPMSCYPDSTFP